MKPLIHCNNPSAKEEFSHNDEKYMIKGLCCHVHSTKVAKATGILWLILFLLGLSRQFIYATEIKVMIYDQQFIYLNGITMLIGTLLPIILYILLFIGLWKKNSNFILPFLANLIFSFILTVICVVLLLFLPIIGIIYSEKISNAHMKGYLPVFTNTAFVFAALFFALIFALFAAYIAWCIRILYACCSYFDDLRRYEKSLVENQFDHQNQKYFVKGFLCFPSHCKMETKIIGIFWSYVHYTILFSLLLTLQIFYQLKYNFDTEYRDLVILKNMPEGQAFGSVITVFIIIIINLLSIGLLFLGMKKKNRYLIVPFLAVSVLNLIISFLYTLVFVLMLFYYNLRYEAMIFVICVAFALIFGLMTFYISWQISIVIKCYNYFKDSAEHTNINKDRLIDSA